MRHLLDLLFDECTEGRCLVAADGTIVRANAEWLRSIGLSLDAVLGVDIVALSPATRDAVLAMHARARAGHHVEVPRHPKQVEGRETWWEGSIDPVPLDGGTGLLVTAREVSPPRDDRRGAAAFEERLRLVIEAMPQIVCVIEPDGRPEYVNSAWTAFSGLDLEATAREGWLGLLHPDDLDAARSCRARALKGLAPQHSELRYRAADGTYHWYLSHLAPIVECGRVVRLIGAALCIEDRKRAEASLRESITDRKRTELELREANERLRHADRHKNEFLGMLSHELRNPLAPMRNALYILDHTEPEGEQARRAKEVMNRQLTHLTRLVDDLLDVTRIGRGKIELRRSEVDLAALAHRTAEDHRALMQDRGLALTVDVPSERIVVNGDDTRLAQVLGNLLSNAAKFTPAGGRVTLTVRADECRGVVHVQDTGPGIEAHMLQSIFEPFTQGTQTLARSDGGLGLGLALVKGLVALHGGEVLAVSGGAGQGTDFVVTLPLGAAPAREERAPGAQGLRSHSASG
jgi:PAS domain S-box-containing protein